MVLITQALKLYHQDRIVPLGRATPHFPLAIDQIWNHKGRLCSILRQGIDLLFQHGKDFISS